MKNFFAPIVALTATAIIVTAAGCTSMSNLNSRSVQDYQDNTIIVMGNGISYLGE